MCACARGRGKGRERRRSVCPSPTHSFSLPPCLLSSLSHLFHHRVHMRMRVHVRCLYAYVHAHACACACACAVCTQFACTPAARHAEIDTQTTTQTDRTHARVLTLQRQVPGCEASLHRPCRYCACICMYVYYILSMPKPHVNPNPQTLPPDPEFQCQGPGC